MILNCEKAEFPITYLGLPLSNKKLRKIHFLPLIEATRARIHGWQTKYLSLAGRLTLVKSVLSSIPLHFLQALKLPNWVYLEMDKLRRNFLWKGSDKCLGGHCLVNWETCSLPKRNGGLGIIHLPTQNEALLTRWLWKLISDPDSIWSKTIRNVYGSDDIVSLSTSTRLSHNMRNILNLAPLLNCSITRDGTTQEVSWRWTTDEDFSAKSAYTLMRQPGCFSPLQANLWKIKAPHKIKMFLWLLFLNRLLTRDNILKRSWPTNPHFVLCNSQVGETAAHLFLHCPFILEVYTLVNRTISPQSALVQLTDHWRRVRAQQPRSNESVWIATLWNVWKERNHVIFQESVPNVRRVASKSIQEAAVWSSNY